MYVHAPESPLLSLPSRNTFPNAPASPYVKSTHYRMDRVSSSGPFLYRSWLPHVSLLNKVDILMNGSTLSRHVALLPNLIRELVAREAHPEDIAD